MESAVPLPNGRSVALLGPGEAGGLSRTTGWTTWDSAHVLLTYLHEREHLAGVFVADISTGNGFVALGCAALGAAEVVATEVARCAELTKKNVELNVAIGDEADPWARRVQVMEYQWGEELCEEIENCSVAILCDALFIAIRDGIEEELLDTLMRLCDKGAKVLFIYEERVVAKEDAFVSGARMRLLWEEIPSESLNLDAARDAFASSEETGMADMFYEAPSVRLWTVSKRAGNGESLVEGGSEP